MKASCVICGVVESEAAVMLVAPLASVCRECVASAASMIGLKPERARKDPHQRCALCGSCSSERIVYDGSAVCVGCIGILEEIRLETASESRSQ
jgi:hypothetical protein